ncbi:OrNVorf79-like [Venturia canescens]|uniref:OrNVorf79-like n=1 Tax=Venturia canescens TaxID=32260 RepID=A0ACB9ZIB1_9HYME|nr:uncharacterized LOC122410074 [Venturia canescens]KAI5630616.1 OrNVorf79-like [Venturia canescens]
MAEIVKSDESRDSRFKDIVREQLGENGLTLMVNLSFLFVTCLVFIVLIMIAFLVSQPKELGLMLELKAPALLASIY